jgi:hypothetical protein
MKRALSIFKLPIKWSDGHLMEDEKALAASLGAPYLDPPNIAPDIIITNFIFGTLVRATPCN